MTITSTHNAQVLILHEDEDLLTVNKPAGWNTHAPSPWSGEGIYDWLRHRDPRWASLAIIHRLDKETSGVLVFAKSERACKSLTAQFTDRTAHKRYLLLTDQPVSFSQKTVHSQIQRIGDRYASTSPSKTSEAATTEFIVQPSSVSNLTLIEARPATGRTHQIRVHAADLGIPILGDQLYGGSKAHRVHLHASELRLTHPTLGTPIQFSAPPRFDRSNAQSLREAIIDPSLTTAWRAFHGAADHSPQFYADRFGPSLLCETVGELDPCLPCTLPELALTTQTSAIRHKELDRRVRGKTVQQTSPKQVWGSPSAPTHDVISENGARFEIRFDEGYSVGLFLDQRDNRRRLLTNHVARLFPVLPTGLQGRSLLNLFAYTCGFSVCGALAGAHTTSLDLSKKYLDWGRRNFTLNHLDPSAHDFIYGDAFDWLKRFHRKGRRFDVVVVDPPTFSQSRESGVFRAEKDFTDLAAIAADVVAPGGTLFLSTNAAGLLPERFAECARAALHSRNRSILQTHFAPQPPDFPITREEPGHLKTLWLRLS